MNPIDTGIIFAYLATMVALGLYANRKQDNVEDYFVASGRIGTLSIACLWLAGWVVGVPIVVSHGGSWSAVTTTLPDNFFDIGGWGWPTILALVVSISLSFFTAMDNFTRCFAARSEQAARRGTLIAAALLLPLMLGTVWMGLAAKVLIPDMGDSGDVLTRLVMETFPVGLKGLLLVGMLSALMSTADICILTASANATRDIYQRYINPNVAPKRMLRLSMIASAVIGAVATLMAWLMQDVINILLVAFTINSAALFLPTVAMVYFERVSKAAAFWSISGALTTVVAWYAISRFSEAPVFELDPLWPGLLVSFLVFTVMNRGDRATP